MILCSLSFMLFVFILLCGFVSASVYDSSILDFYSSIFDAQYVDLTHAFDTVIPQFEGDPPLTRHTIYNYSHDGFFAEWFCHLGQWGTHLDPPIHFHEGMRTVEDLTTAELFMPLVVIDVSSKVAANPDYVLQMSDITEWEGRHGKVPAGSFVAMRTDWSKRWPNNTLIHNADVNGTEHYPGWSMATLQYLYLTRNITASGHETTDTDPGLVTSNDEYPLESYILGLNHYQIELVANLNLVPEAGAIAYVAIPKIAKGSGFPVRIIAIVPSTNFSFWDAYTKISSKTRIDLTHAFDSGIPHWGGFPDMARETAFNYTNDGFFAEWFCHVGQWGTHVDPPAHFIEGGRFVDQITVREMVMPLVVFDVTSAVASNHDYVITMTDVHAWEAKYGKVPAGSFAVMKTGWSSRWPNNTLMHNADLNGTYHYPGWSQEVLTYLYESRNITASGHETTDTDRGIDTTHDKFPLETYILSKSHYQIELLADLTNVPEYGALALVSFPKIANGSGFPARVIAIIPDEERNKLTTTRSTTSAASITKLGNVSLYLFCLATFLIFVL